MILNSYINEQLGAGHRRDLLEAAERYRLAGRVRAHDRDRFRRHAPSREALRSHTVESLLGGSAPRTAMR